MQDQRIALRYADSVLELAEDQNKSEAILADMELISSAMVENNELLVVLKNPLIKSAKKNDILNAVFNGKLSDLTLSLIKLLCDKDRVSVLPYVAEQFVKLYKETKKIVGATVTTAVEMDEAFRTKVSNLIKANFDGSVELTEKVDADIIGGFILQIGDQRLNNSVAHKLSTLRREFDSNLYIKE